MPHPVISRMNMGIYFTFDGGTIRSHFVPQVVLWNPWSEPIAPQPLFVRFEFSNHHIEGFKLYFRVSHPDWDGGRHRWTGGYSMDWAAPPGSSGSNERNSRVFIFELDPVQIPAGASVVFTMDRHRRFTMEGGPHSSTNPYPWITAPDHNPANRDISGLLSEQPIVRLRPGLQEGGGFSMYLEEDFHSKVQFYATVPTTTPGGYSQWRAPRFPMYPPNPSALDDPAFDPAAHRNMSINETGLEGWNFHETRISWSRSDTGSSLGETNLSLGLTANHRPRHSSNLSQQAIFAVRGIHGRMPNGFHTRGPGDGGWEMVPRFADGLPPPFPGDSTPFTFLPDEFPSFPTWGLTWVLRVPETRFQPGPDAGAADYLFAPLQWLAHSNPTAAYHTPTPNVGSRLGGNQRNYGQVSSFIGGFTLQGPEFFDLSEFTDDDDERYLFFGHSDHLAPPGFETGQIPRVIVRQAPNSVEELTSIASMQHAPLLGMNLLQSNSEWLGSMLPMHPNFWNNGGNLHPAYPIGNSLLMPFANPEQAHTNLFATVTNPGPPPSPPWGHRWDERFSDWRASPWYDLSFTLNHVLWDDFLFSSPANSRIVQPQGRAFSPDAGETYAHANNFTGNRRLSLQEVERLAEEIVNQVRERGPFLSMSDFVNRRLLPANQDPRGHRLMGPLQAAIQAADLNRTQTGSPESRITSNNPVLNSNDFHHWDAEAMAGATNRAASGYLMQADLLSRIGSVLQVRSDTFLIRAYGETPSGARAWCEVLVRRTANFVDAADAPGDMPGSLTSPNNERFGRRFEVIRFQWLGEEDV